jgi:2-C-methyl-D-erythritol 4-phosphate cytidylyltransferase / 2-C-methyl-D-erythritol 2,4-cyclodiphosphate synthase
VSTPAADVVIVAAGSSSRMNGIDKLTAPIAGKPLLARTVRAFALGRPVERIVIVTAPDRVDQVRTAPWLPGKATVVAGGGRRQESVAAGVAELAARGAGDDRIILVHDGARPNVIGSLVMRVIKAVDEHGAAIPLLPVVETLKRVSNATIVETVDRGDLALAQTPQGVRLGLLRAAYERFPPSGPDTFTDEASLLEACTIPVHAVRGQLDNLKVTYPIDLVRAARALNAHHLRAGLGEDSHPFGPGRPLALGGITIPGAPRLHGHSDGDVVLHAVANALLGAAGLGDLGRLFPADSRTPKGIASDELMTEVVDRVHAAGFTPTRIDVTIAGARPKLGAYLDEMRRRIAVLAWLGEDDVSVKASSGNLDGMEGAGRGISARAIATVEPKDLPPDEASES